MVWHRLLHRHPEAPTTPRLRRDPDLDRVREEQHDLINKVTSETLRASMRARRLETIEEAWRRNAGA